MTTITDTHAHYVANPNDHTDTGVDPGSHGSPDTGPEAPSVPEGEGDAQGQMRDYPVEALAPHPDNPRSDLGDLTELARSIKAQGVLQPLLILPTGEDGRHRVVAGHRRLAAAMKAKQARVPAIVRDLTPAEVVEAFLIENGQRSDLTLSETSGIASDAIFGGVRESLAGGVVGSGRRGVGACGAALSWGSTICVAVDATMLG